MNQRGFLVASLLILMPFFMSAFAVIASAFLLLRGDWASRHACRVELLNAQAQAAEDLEKLLALNDQAETWRLKRADAESALRLAERGAKVGASAYLGVVKAQQLAFAAQQKALILHARFISRTAPTGAITKISTAAQTASATRTLLPASQTRAGTFPLVAKPPGSPTPEYRPAPGFSKDQTMRVRWSYPVAVFLPEWIARHLKLNQLTAAAECAATIERETDKEIEKWRPKIAKDPKGKYSSNFW